MSNNSHSPYLTPGIRAACLWGDKFEHRIDFDATSWFEHFDDDDILSHFETTVRVQTSDGDLVADFSDMHPEWGRVELVTELMDDDPAFISINRWLASKEVAGWNGSDDGEPITEFIDVYLSRVDAVEWLRVRRPDLFADIKATYTVPPAEHRLFP